MENKTYSTLEALQYLKDNKDEEFNTADTLLKYVRNWKLYNLSSERIYLYSTDENGKYKQSAFDMCFAVCYWSFTWTLKPKLVNWKTALKHMRSGKIGREIIADRGAYIDWSFRHGKLKPIGSCSAYFLTISMLDAEWELR